MGPRLGRSSIAFALTLGSIVALAGFPVRAHAEGGAAPTATTATAAAAAVRILDRQVFLVRARRGTASPEERARVASHALERALEDPQAEVRVEGAGAMAVVYAGDIPIIQLGQADADKAGDGSLEVHAKAVAAAVTEALNSEKRRNAVSNTLLSVSLVVFSALLALLLARKIAELAHRAKDRLATHPSRLPMLRFGGVELVHPAALESVVGASVGLGRWLVQFGVLYVWLLFVLSLFESTRAHTEALTGLVLGPLSALIGRIGSALPLLVVAAIAILALAALLRFAALYFEAVERKETELDWLPPDLAGPVSSVVRLSIVVLALFWLAPLMSAEAERSPIALGVAIALGLAAVPLLGSAAVGIWVVFGRRIRLGDRVEIAGVKGVVRSLDLLEMRVIDDTGAEVGVPHLLRLRHATRVVHGLGRVEVEIAVEPGSPLAEAEKALVEGAARAGHDVRVELRAVDPLGARFVVSAVSERRTALLMSLIEVLGQRGIALARAGDSAPRKGAPDGSGARPA
jgi:small-conductance mechanosensitive channel